MSFIKTILVHKQTTTYSAETEVCFQLFYSNCVGKLFYIKKINTEKERKVQVPQNCTQKHYLSKCFPPLYASIYA